MVVNTQGLAHPHILSLRSRSLRPSSLQQAPLNVKHTSMSSSSAMDRYTSLDEEEDKSSVESLLGKEEFDTLQKRHRSVSFYRQHERSILWNLSLFILNVIICLGYTHWLGSQYAHFQPIYPCE